MERKVTLGEVRDALEQVGVARKGVLAGELYKGLTTLRFSAADKVQGARGYVYKDGELQALAPDTSVKDIPNAKLAGGVLVVESFKEGQGAYRTARVYNGDAIVAARPNVNDDDDVVI